MIKEFKKFISKGNVIDLAVGVIIGGAFSKIVTSLVNDILTPLLGIVLGGIDFSALTLKVKDATINYGLFIQNIIDFLITAFCIFLIVKFINKLNDLGTKLVEKEKKLINRDKKEEKKEEVKEDVKVEENILLLREIRNLLKKQNNNNK